MIHSGLMINNWLESHIALHSFDSPKEEMANAYTHLFGGILSLVAFFLMEKRLYELNVTSVAVLWGFAIYGISMILLYFSSSIYHFIKPSNWKRVFRILDHSNIYILIAGTYTPFCLVMNRERGLPLLGFIWSLVVVGIIFKLIFWGRLRVVHTLLYLIMGWLVAFYLGDLKAVVPMETAYWIIGGGLFYTVGTLFYASKKLPFYHAIWHLFVLGGSAFFWLGIFLHVMPVIASQVA
jgi:hemolysin III